jgi:hypothetical protein
MLSWQKLLTSVAYRIRAQWRLQAVWICIAFRVWIITLLWTMTPRNTAWSAMTKNLVAVNLCRVRTSRHFVWIILVAVLARSTCLKAFIDRYRRIALCGFKETKKDDRLVQLISVSVRARQRSKWHVKAARVRTRSSCRFNPMTLRKQMRVGTRCKVNIPVPVVEFV